MAPFYYGQIIRMHYRMTLPRRNVMCVIRWQTKEGEAEEDMAKKIW